MTGFLGFGKQQLENCWSLDNRGRGYLLLEEHFWVPQTKLNPFDPQTAEVTNNLLRGHLGSLNHPEKGTKNSQGCFCGFVCKKSFQICMRLIVVGGR